MVKKIVLIVEGTNDENQIVDAFRDMDCKDYVKCLVTEGTKVNNRIRAEIEDLYKKGYEPYVLSDPDIAGFHLYEMIQHWYPDIPRLEVDPRECAYFTGKKFKAGVEYSSHTYLKKIICPLIGVEYKPKQSPICWD
jgi:5S rRNA maturation endonuclease (ribonuclease M5)